MKYFNTKNNKTITLLFNTDFLSQITNIEIYLFFTDPREELCFKENAVFDESFTMSCKTNGLPTPFPALIHNNTKVVSNSKIYAIRVVQYSYAGLYKMHCR